jgi:uncharacterized protein (TIGR02145 family)
MKHFFTLFMMMLFLANGYCQISIIGPASPSGNWTTDHNLTETSTGVWTGTFTLNAGDLKFRQNGSWTNNWGALSFPYGTGVHNGPDNIPVSPAGTYLITFNTTTLAYSFVAPGSIGIGTIAPHASAALDVTSTNKGFLPPRMTLAQRDAIATPAEGLMISCTDCSTKGLHQFINGAWQAMMSSNTGNYGTVVNPVTGKIWLDRNLGAMQVATSSTDAASYGDLYQWGRAADGHQIRTSATQGTQATTFLADEGNNLWDGKFIIGFSDWLTPAATDLWSGTAAENNPCPSGYRVPTNAEWNQERRTWTSNNAAGAFASPLKLPCGGQPQQQQWFAQQCRYQRQLLEQYGEWHEYAQPQLQ